jgi:hypothetical protein
MFDITVNEIVQFVDRNNQKIVDAAPDEMEKFYDTTIDITVLGETIKLPFNSVSFNGAMALCKLYQAEWFGGLADDTK